MSKIKHGAGIFSWKKKELKAFNRKTSEWLTIYGMDYPRADVNEFYLRRVERGEGLIEVEDCVQIKVGRCGVLECSNNVIKRT